MNKNHTPATQQYCFFLQALNALCDRWRIHQHRDSCSCRAFIYLAPSYPDEDINRDLMSPAAKAIGQVLGVTRTTTGEYQSVLDRGETPTSLCLYMNYNGDLAASLKYRDYSVPIDTILKDMEEDPPWMKS